MADLRKAGNAVKIGVALAASAAPQTRGDPNKIKVGVRCRPLSNTEKGLDQEVIVQFAGTDICLTNPAPGNGEPPEHVFAYDYLYDMESQSESVFTDMAQPLVEGLFEGFNGTIFAYGQTGSGKTHSMMGNASDPGVIPRVAIDVFERSSALVAAIGDKGGVVKVMASYIQIYREVLQDLLGDVTADLKIRRDPKFGTYVQGLSERVLDSADGLTQVIEQGNKKRAVASTLMNSESSRSHAVVIIRLEQEHPADVLAGRGKKKIGSKINLVDLAGSERASKTGATGETLKEAIAINQSLSALGNVINALSDPKAKGHIPYRSSKLTHLLEESLGGNSHTVMLAAISPAARNFPETLQTLQYASRAKEIKTNAKANAFSEEIKGGKFGAEQAAAQAAALAAAQADMAAQVAAAQEQAQQQMQSMLASMSKGGASSEELSKAQSDLAEVKASLAAAQAVAELVQSQLNAERARADEAERQKVLSSESHVLALEALRSDAAEGLRRAEVAARDREQLVSREVEQLKQLLEAKTREHEAAAQQAEKLNVDSLEGQVMRAQMGEELKAKSSELHAAQLKNASSDERAASLTRELEQARAQARQAEAQRDEHAARAQLLEGQKQSAELAVQVEREAKEQAQAQLQQALSAQVELQRKSAESASANHAAEVAGSLAAVQQALQRLEQKTEQQQARKADETSTRTKGHEDELARLDGLLKTQSSAHASSIEQLERRASAEAQRLSEAAKRAAEQHQQQLAELSGRLREAMEARVRLQSENATRKAAADALGERVAMLQDQLASSQLDLEQQRHVRIAERAELEEAGRAKAEELEAMRLQVLQHTHEADGLKAQLRERDESLARRAERLRQLQALYERALQDKQRVEEASWAERQELHEERRSLELRVREEAGRARQAIEYVQRSGGGAHAHDGHVGNGGGGGGGLLSRLFNGGGGGSTSSPTDAKEMWAERPAPPSLTDSQRMPYSAQEHRVSTRPVGRPLPGTVGSVD